MKITIRRAGGFAPAAQRRTYEIDGSTLAPADAAALRTWVGGHTALPMAAAPAAPDAFHYTVTVEHDDGTSQTRRAGEHELPEAARRVINLGASGSS